VSDGWVEDGWVEDRSLAFFRMDDTDLHILLEFPALLAMHVFQYRFSFCRYNECIAFTWMIHV